MPSGECGASPRGERKMTTFPAAGLHNTLNRQAKRGSCLVKIHFTKGLPAGTGQDPPSTATHIHPYRQYGSLIPALAALADRGGGAP